jgi:hypothetical protein
MNLFKYCNQEAIVAQREDLKRHCIMLIEHIYNHRYAIKLLLAATAALETIADYKANRSGIFVNKYPKNDN